MKDKADALEAALKRKQRAVSRYTIDEKSNLALFRSQVQQILQEHPTAAFNATGGLKTMSIIAHEVFLSAGRPVFYNERDNRIIWLNPIEAPQQRIPGVMGIEDYFSAFGQTLHSIRRTPLSDDGGVSMLNMLNTLPKAGHGDHNGIGKRFESLVFRAASNALKSLKNTGKQDIAWNDCWKQQSIHPPRCLLKT